MEEKINKGSGGIGLFKGVVPTFDLLFKEQDLLIYQGFVDDNDVA